MPFSKGQIIFGLIFLVAFIIFISWMYFKDKSYLKIHYKKTYFIVIAILLILVAFRLFVKLMS